ncbi:MAG: hypothetical protein C4290_14890 [Chloroflexota bacterium]
MSEHGHGPEGTPPPADERLRVLELLEQRKITAAEAAELLSALEERESVGDRRPRYRWKVGESQHDRPRWFRIRVTDVRTGRTRANVSIPITMVGIGLGVAHRWRVPGGRHLDDLLAFLRSGRRGTVFDVCSGPEGDRIEIFVE